MRFVRRAVGQNYRDDNATLYGFHVQTISCYQSNMLGRYVSINSGSPSDDKRRGYLVVLLSTTSSQPSTEIIFFNIQSTSKSAGSFHLARASLVAVFSFCGVWSHYYS